MRVEFRLSMPGRNSWNGRWSGDERNYTIVKMLPNKRAAELLDNAIGGDGNGHWSYSFGDGWVASVTARILNHGERAKKSDGFCGYDWMVDSILSRGKILGLRELLAGKAVCP